MTLYTQSRFPTTPITEPAASLVQDIAILQLNFKHNWEHGVVAPIVTGSARFFADMIGWVRCDADSIQINLLATGKPYAVFHASRAVNVYEE
jgi:hypothetical protein